MKPNAPRQRFEAAEPDRDIRSHTNGRQNRVDTVRDVQRRRMCAMKDWASFAAAFLTLALLLGCRKSDSNGAISPENPGSLARGS